MPKSPLEIGIVVIGVALVTSVLFYIQSKYENTFYSDVVTARASGILWIANNVLDEGLFLYTTNTETGETPTTNNAIRQMMTSRVIASESQSDDTLLPTHQKNLSYVMTNWYREENGFGYVYFNEKSKLGANAMLLRTLVVSPYFESHRNEAEALARGILHLQKDNGSFSAWFMAPNYEYDEEYLLTFYSGEALVALVEYYEKTGDITYLNAAKESANFYINHYATNLEENYYPAYVPWHTIALNKLYKIDPQQKYAHAIFIMNDKLLEIQDTENFMGRFYNPETPEYGTPHTSSDAIYTEGLAYAYEIARVTGDTERSDTYLRAMTLGATYLMHMQITEPIDESPLKESEYLGALRIRENNPWIRVDTTQHTVDAFEKILELLSPNPN